MVLAPLGGAHAQRGAIGSSVTRPEDEVADIARLHAHPPDGLGGGLALAHKYFVKKVCAAAAHAAQNNTMSEVKSNGVLYLHALRAYIFHCARGGPGE